MMSSGRWSSSEIITVGIYRSRSSTHQISQVAGGSGCRQAVAELPSSLKGQVKHQFMVVGALNAVIPTPGLQEMRQRKLDGGWITQVSVMLLEHRAHTKILLLKGEREYLPRFKTLSCLPPKYF